MKILALETSCDDSCAAIVDTTANRLLADVVYSHTLAMRRFGGIVPEVASREHLKALPVAVREALDVAKLDVTELDHIVATNRPGLIGSLLVGVSFGKSLAFASGKPFTALHHIEGHIFSPFLARFEGLDVPPFPWIALVVSGGHTELYRVDALSEVTWLGGTLDDAAGEAFDKTGKLLGLEYPAGPLIDKWVRDEATDALRARFSFPRAKTEGFHFSFSGLKTAVALEVRKGNAEDRLAIAASAQEAILDALVDKLKAAATKEGVAQIVVTGGVACNSRLRAKLPDAYFPKPRHCSDNAAMMAIVAALRAEAGLLPPSPWSVTALPRADLDFGATPR